MNKKPYQSICPKVTGFLIAGEVIKDKRTLETVTQILPYKSQSSIDQSVSPLAPISTLPFIIAPTSIVSPIEDFTLPHLFRAGH